MSGTFVPCAKWPLIPTDDRASTRARRRKWSPSLAVLASTKRRKAAWRSPHSAGRGAGTATSATRSSSSRWSKFVVALLGFSREPCVGAYRELNQLGT